jgi:hypothetical protein
VTIAAKFFAVIGDLLGKMGRVQRFFWCVLCDTKKSRRRLDKKMILRGIYWRNGWDWVDGAAGFS